MSRNRLIEAIHAARYDLENCARHERGACQRNLDKLLRQALDRAGSKPVPSLGHRLSTANAISLVVQKINARGNRP